MPYELPELPYALDALAPFISRETLEYHYGKHHQTYVTNLNNLTKDSELATLPLDQVVKQSSGGIFNNAAQVWNHTFYWNSMTPNSKQMPSGALADAINLHFGSFENFKEKFTQSGLTLFGSGWTWLVKNQQGTLEIVNTANAGTPITENKQPLFTCDVWEHAYYIDVRNARAKYIENFWQIVNWDFAAANYAQS